MTCNNMHLRGTVNLAHDISNHTNWTSCEGWPHITSVPLYLPIDVFAQLQRTLPTTTRLLTVIISKSFPSARVSTQRDSSTHLFIHNSSFCSDALWWMTGESRKSESQESRCLHTTQRLTDSLQLPDSKGAIINRLPKSLQVLYY